MLPAGGGDGGFGQVQDDPAAHGGDVPAEPRRRGAVGREHPEILVEDQDGVAGGVEDRFEQVVMGAQGPFGFLATDGFGPQTAVTPQGQGQGGEQGQGGQNVDCGGMGKVGPGRGRGREAEQGGRQQPGPARYCGYMKA